MRDKVHWEGCLSLFQGKMKSVYFIVYYDDYHRTQRVCRMMEWKNLMDSVSDLDSCSLVWFGINSQLDIFEFGKDVPPDGFFLAWSWNSVFTLFVEKDWVVMGLRCFTNSLSLQVQYAVSLHKYLIEGIRRKKKQQRGGWRTINTTRFSFSCCFWQVPLNPFSCHHSCPGWAGNHRFSLGAVNHRDMQKRIIEVFDLKIKMLPIYS